MKRNIFILLLLFLYCNSYSQQGLYNEEKIQLEKSIQEKVERIIEKIVGNKNFVVVPNIYLKISSPTTTNLNSQQPSYFGANQREVPFLPGIDFQYLPITSSQQNTPPQTVIDKILINIIVDTSLSEKFVSQIKSAIPYQLDLDTSRGDSINITKIDFQKVPTWQLLMEQLMPHLYIPFIILLIAIFLFGPVTHFFKTVVKAVQLRIDADARLTGAQRMDMTGQMQQGLLPGMEPLGLPGGGMAGSPTTMELSVGGKKEKEGPKKHFDFINKSNLKNLWYLIKDETPSTIALVMNYISSDLVTELMTMLDRKTQAKVALELASVKLPDPQEVQEVEQSIKSKIDYCIGGEEYFLNLLDQADKDVQEDILQTLSFQNPSLAEKLREKIFLFEDILFLDKNTLQKIIRETQRRGISIAIALKGTEDEIKNKVMDCLTEGGRAMLAEQMDLLGELGEKVIRNEQKKIVSTIRELANTGDISIDRSKFVKEQVEKQKSVTIEPEIVEKK